MKIHLYNVPLWYICVYMYVFIWRLCLGRVQKVSSYDLKCLQEPLPFLKATVSKCLVTFFILNAKVMKLPSLRTKQFSWSRFHTPVLWSVLSWKETLCITLITDLKVPPAGICMKWTVYKWSGRSRSSVGNYRSSAEHQEHHPVLTCIYTTTAPLLLVPKGGGYNISLAV